MVSPLDQVLAGKRILVTAQRRSAELAGALERRGASVTVVPMIGAEVGVDEATLMRRTRNLIATGVDVVVATTGVGMGSWFEVASGAGLATDLTRVLREAQLVARGPQGSWRASFRRAHGGVGGRVRDVDGDSGEAPC